MDTTAHYKEIVKQVIQKYAQLRPSHGDIRLDTVFDETQSRYALMQVGWDRGRRVRGNLIYIKILDGLVRIEYDGMESSIAQDFIVASLLKAEVIWLKAEVRLTSSFLLFGFKTPTKTKFGGLRLVAGRNPPLIVPFSLQPSALSLHSMFC